MKINKEKCYVDKRRLVLDCEIRGKNYIFTYDGWDRDTESCTMDGKPINFTVITAYKHCVQAYFDTFETDEKVFIDRRYEHNYEYDVYFAGNHYFVDLSALSQPKKK